nr:hypothetical protein [Tanacetum cinerariifolium]
TFQGGGEKCKVVTVVRRFKMSKHDVHLFSKGEEKVSDVRTTYATMIVMIVVEKRMTHDRGLGGTSEMLSSKRFDDEEKLVHGKMVVKFVVLRVGDEEVVVGEGVVVISSSLDLLTNSCLGGIMVSLIFLEGLDEEALVEFMVEWCEEDADRNEEDDLFN